MTEFKNSKIILQYTNDPLQNFLYALKAPDSKRQYPRRFEYFLYYLGLTGTLKEKCLIFYEQAKQEPLWTQHQIMQYIEYQKERIDKGEIKESTINNYYKSVKLFCEMNDIILNWKKIAKGKPQDDESTKEDDDNDVENIRVTLRLKKNFANMLRLLAKYYDNGDIDKFTSEEVSKIICALAESSSSTILGPSISDELEQHIQSLLKDEQKKT